MISILLFFVFSLRICFEMVHAISKQILIFVHELNIVDINFQAMVSDTIFSTRQEEPDGLQIPIYLRIRQSDGDSCCAGAGEGR